MPQATVSDPRGLKRICMSCSTRFYDLNARPIICPNCETEFTGEVKIKNRRGRVAATDVADDVTEADETVEAVELEDDEDEIESDDDTVSLEDAEIDGSDDDDDDLTIDDDDLDDDLDDDDDLDVDLDEEDK